MKAKTIFKLASWNESAYATFGDKSKMTKVTAKKTYTGDLSGEGSLEYLMAYQENGDAHYVGLERVAGKLKGTEGSFILRHTGLFTAGKANIEISVLSGSGTGGLEGLEGGGSFSIGSQKESPIEIEYSLEPVPLNAAYAARKRLHGVTRGVP
jgi:hypothetical protein